MPDARVFRSIEDIEPDLWDACFTDALETHAYLKAVEAAGLPGFTYCYVTAWDETGPIAAAPAFFTEYALDTTATGAARRVTSAIRRVAPGLLSLRLGCLGSPCTETASLGFAHRLAPDRRGAALRALVSAFEAEARARGAALFAVRDAPVAERPVWDEALRPLGYAAAPGMPVARLRTDFASIDDYLRRLSAATRKDMRRKLQTRQNVRIEVCHNIDRELGRIQAIYDAARARAELQFEELTPAYFAGVLAQMPGRSVCTLYYDGDALLGFNLLLENETTLLDKFFCMDGPRARALNLYFLSWFTNAQRCIDRGLTWYQSGQAAYENKLRLGSELIQTVMYFRHRNAVISKAMQLVAPLFLSGASFGAVTR